MITTKRLNIRQPKIEDLEKYLKMRNSEFVLKYNCMKKLDVKSALLELKSKLDSRTSLFIEDKDTKELIGCIFFDEDDLRYNVNSTALSYFIDQDYQNRGFMKEALSAVIPYKFSEGIDIITARVFSLNIPSMKLLLSVGFIQEGVLRHCVSGYNGVIYDDVLFSLMQKDLDKLDR